MHIPSVTADNPMIDVQIEAKFLAKAEPAIGRERTRRTVELAWSLEQQSDTRELIALLA
jgi:hypothetical protein